MATVHNDSYMKGSSLVSHEVRSAQDKILVFCNLISYRFKLMFQITVSCIQNSVIMRMTKGRVD